MTPSIDDRIVSMMTALREVILPALSMNSFATEQAKLILAHLGLLRDQVDHSVRYEQLQLGALVAFTAELGAHVAGGQRTTVAGQALVLELAHAADARRPAEVRVVTQAISAALSNLVEAVSIDGTRAFQDQLREALLDHVEHKALQDRAWFAGAGFEFNAADLPAISALIDQMEDEAGLSGNLTRSTA